MYRPLRNIVLVLLVVLAIASSAWAAGARLFREELDLPIRGLSQRVTQQFRIGPGETKLLFDEQGPGCIFHWWLTCDHGKKPGQTLEMPHELLLRLYYDGQQQPSVEMTLAQFFSILLERDLFTVDNAAIKVLPRNPMNCYLPIPFQHLRMELCNKSRFVSSIWFMADWHAYAGEQAITPLRLHAVFHREAPDASFCSFRMADLSGEGFLAGMVMGVEVQDRSDAWYHNGGDLVLLDGETAPRALRGIGGEDVFNMSFGIWPVQTEWVGAPYVSKTEKDTKLGSGDEGIMYRIFGPAPIWFNNSAMVRFGCKGNHLESVVYAYLDPRPVPEVITLKQWKLAGPFPCSSYEQFQTPQWPEKPIGQWPRTHVADFDPYIADLNRLPKGPTEFEVPQTADTQHTWCDFAEYYRGRQRTNRGAQPSNVCAYAVGHIDVPAAGDYDLHLGFDDWMTVWVNGQKVFSGRHDHGFKREQVPLSLPAGSAEIRVKLSNQDNLQWRLWAFSLRLSAAQATP